MNSPVLFISFKSSTYRGGVSTIHNPELSCQWNQNRDFLGKTLSVCRNSLLKHNISWVTVVLMQMPVESSQVYVYLCKDGSRVHLWGRCCCFSRRSRCKENVFFFPFLPHQLEDSQINQTLYLFHQLYCRSRENKTPRASAGYLPNCLRRSFCNIWQVVGGHFPPSMPPRWPGRRSDQKRLCCVASYLVAISLC